MQRDLFSSITSEFAGRILHALIAGLLLLFLTRTLGPESYGIYALALSIFAFSRLFSEAGFARAAARYVAEYKDHDQAKTDAVLTQSSVMVIAAATLVSMAVVLLADPIAMILDEPALAPVLVFGSGIVLFYSLHQYNRIILQGYERVATSAKLHATEAVFSGVFVVAFVLYSPSAVSAVLGFGVGYGLATIVGARFVRKVRTPSETTASIRTEVRSQVALYTAPLTVTRLSNVVDQQVDVLLVGFFLNPLAVAYYSIGKELSRLISVPAASVGFALSPTYGADKAAGRLESAVAVYQESLTKVLVLYVPACTGIVLVADIAIPTIFGAGYEGAVTVVQILAVFIFFQALVYISSPAIDYLGRARSEATVKFGTSTANLLLNLLLIPLVGVVGAAVATVLTQGVFALATVYIVYTELPFDPAAVGRTLGRVTAVTAIMAVVVFGLLQAFSGYAALTLGVGVGTGVWLVSCHVFDLLDYRELATMLTQ